MADALNPQSALRGGLRRREADRFGMLVFLASEVMLFGAIFAAAMAVRLMHPAGYDAAAGQLDILLGTANTAILLTSSLMAALGVEAVRAGRPGRAAAALGGTIALGAAFLGVKALEYTGEYAKGLMPGTASAHFNQPVDQLFMNLYLLATGLHALHVIAGLCLLTIALSGRARRDRPAVLIGNAALYWHLVDIVWIFLYPTFYLAGVK